MLKLALSGTSPKFHTIFNLRELCQYIKSVGVTDLELVDLNCDLKPGEVRQMGRWSQIDVEKTKKVLEEEGCKAPILQFRFGMNQQLNHDVQMHVNEFKACLNAAEKLGSKTVLHYLGFTVFQDLDLDLVHKYLDEPLAYAKQKGIKLVLENEFENPCTNSPEKMLKIMESYEDPYFLTNYDAPNYQVDGDEGYPYAYNLLKKYIGYTHLKNVCRYVKGFYNEGYSFPEEERGEVLVITGGKYDGDVAAFVPTFEGQVNTYGMLKRLVEDGYDGYITFEPHASIDIAMKDIQNDIKLLKEYGFIG